MHARAILLALVVAAAPLAAQAAPSVATTLAGAERAELLRVRKEVWVHWFTGDTAGLRRVLAPELVAISGDDPGYQSLATPSPGRRRSRGAGERSSR